MADSTSRQERKGRVVELDEEGYFDDGPERIFLGAPEDFPESWEREQEAQYREIEELERETLDPDFFTELIQSWEDRLLEILEGQIRTFTDEEKKVDPFYPVGFHPLKLDVGQGLQEYFLPRELVVVGETPLEERRRERRLRKAWTALGLLLSVKKEDRADTLTAIRLGQAIEGLKLEWRSERLLAGRDRQRAQANGGANSGQLTLEEKRLLIGERDRLRQANAWSKAKAACECAAQLEQGAFPGIEKSVFYEPTTIAKW